MRRLGVLGAVPLFKGGPEIEFTVPLLTVPLGLCGSGGVCVARHCGNGAPTNGAPHFVRLGRDVRLGILYFAYSYLMCGSGISGTALGTNGAPRSWAREVCVRPEDRCPY